MTLQMSLKIQGKKKKKRVNTISLSICYSVSLGYVCNVLPSSPSPCKFLCILQGSVEKLPPPGNPLVLPQSDMAVLLSSTMSNLPSSIAGKRGLGPLWTPRTHTGKAWQVVDLPKKKNKTNKKPQLVEPMNHRAEFHDPSHIFSFALNTAYVLHL